MTSNSTATQNSAASEIFNEIRRWPIFDPHSHINPHQPAARHFEEVLGYHYYTELAHSSGMPASDVDSSLTPQTRARNLAESLGKIDNTIQYTWLLEIARTFHGFSEDAIHPGNIDDLFQRADRQNDGKTWDKIVWDKTNLDVVFLTNNFDDPLEGWDTSKYVPCLRTDDLVLKLHEPSTIERLKRATNVDVGDYKTLREAVGILFEHFVAKGAKACAISLPPDFVPTASMPKRGATPLRRALHQLPVRLDELDEIRKLVFWTLAEFCNDFKRPFDLMIGPIRNVYGAGVHGGRDLFDRRVSLYDYRDLFNHFANVTFPVSTLSPDAGAELVAYSWIFPNVVPHGHWWYSNIPSYISADLGARLQAVPKTKLIGYYSDAYKLEFVLPKFNMYRRILSETLAVEGVQKQGWPIDRALEIAHLLLIGNPKRIFFQTEG